MNKTALRHMMLHDDTLADEFDAILNYRTTHAGLVLPSASTPYPGHNMVAFDGSDTLYQIAALFPDAQYGTIALKFRPSNNAPGAFQRLLHFGAASRNLSIQQTTGLLAFNMVAGGTTIADTDILPGQVSTSTDYTVQISWAGSSTLSETKWWIYVNGVLPSGFSEAGINWGLEGLELLLTNCTTIGIGGAALVGPTITPSFTGTMGFVWIGAGSNSGYNLPSTAFYNGGDVDLSTIAVTPQIFFGGTQTAADWNAGTNQGSAGGTFTMTGDVTS